MVPSAAGGRAPGGPLAAGAASGYNWCCTRRRRSMKLLVTLERDETGMVVAECPAIPGCVSQGKTEDEAIANVREAIAAWVKALRGQRHARHGCHQGSRGARLMARLPVLSGAQVVKAFERAGWRVDRQRGSRRPCEDRTYRESVRASAQGSRTRDALCAHTGIWNERRRIRRSGMMAGWSGRRDSNSGPPEPHSGALARLRYAPTVRHIIPLSAARSKVAPRPAALALAPAGRLGPRRDIRPRPAYNCRVELARGRNKA